jgi:hypothetical protein
MRIDSEIKSVAIEDDTTLYFNVNSHAHPAFSPAFYERTSKQTRRIKKILGALSGESESKWRYLYVRKKH